jgi:DNA-binding PadR family transcriptional regulator
VSQVADPYGMNIRREIQSRIGRDISIGSVYITLARLRDKGLVSDSLQEADAGGPRRRFFSLTPKGVDALRDARRTQRQLWKGVVIRAGGKS